MCVCVSVYLEMNAESSRSHLVVGIVIESTNITNGTVHRGKVRCACKYTVYVSHIQHVQCIIIMID